MTLTVTTTNPVRTDVPAPATSPRPTHTDRRWAFAGLASGLLGAGTIVTSSMAGVVYEDKFNGTTNGVADALSDKAGVLFAFHSITALGAVLMVVFAAGLFRRLKHVLPDSIVPGVAAAGLLGTALVSILGSGLDTEYMVAFAQGGDIVDDPTSAMYDHWIGTIPWLWTLAGLAGLGLYAAARRAGVPRWIGRVGLVLGGLTLALGISPLEYMSGVTGVLLVVITSLGLAFGDRAHRGLTR
jgi:hypothetical protein